MLKKIVVSFLLIAVMLPAGLAQATIYVPYPGQSINVATSGLSPASVNIKLVDLMSVGAQTFGISAFGRGYTLDVSTSQFLNAAGSPITLQSFAVGSRINVIGTLDATTPFLIHAQIVRNIEVGTGSASVGVFTGGAQPTVDLIANPTTVNPGATSTLAWTSTNAISCSGSRVGDPPLSRTLSQIPFSTVPLYTTTSWSITCTGALGTTPATDTVTVTVASGDDGGTSTTTPPGGGGGGSTTGLCAGGAQDSHQGGLVETLGEPVIALVRQALGCSSGWTLSWPPESLRYHGTANYKILWRTWNYGVAMRIGTEKQKTDARNFLIDLLDRELVEGHNFDEALTTSHYQIHLHGMAAARLLAVHYNDARLLAATGKWWRQEFSLYDLLGRDGIVYSPGWRSSEPTSPLRDVVYAMVKGRSLPGSAGSPTSNWWSNYYHVGAWTLRNLLRMGDDLGGAAQATKDSESPTLPNNLCAYTRGNDFVFVFPKMTRGIDVLFWVARINGTVSQAPYDPGGAPGNNPYPAPDLVGSQLQIVQGIGGDTSGCPPQ